MHILKNRVHSRSLEELHNKYVLVPADKAAQNVIIVCKKYYLEVVLKEIDTTITYEHVMEECQGIVDRHIKFLNNHRIDVRPECRCLPLFYWLPKLHKRPYGTRLRTEPIIERVVYLRM